MFKYSVNVKLLTKHHLEFLSLKGSCTGWSESIHVKMPHCWKSTIFLVCHVLGTQKNHLKLREPIGSVVEYLTGDRGAAGSSLTGVTALWSLSKTHLSQLSTGSTQEVSSLFNLKIVDGSSALDKLLGQLGIYATWLSSIAYLQKQLRIFIYFFTPRIFLL